MKIIIQIIFITLMFLMFSCASTRLNYHVKQTQKILNNNPELKKNFDTLYVKYIDTSTVQLKIDTVIDYKIDTIKIKESIDSLFYLKLIADSIKNIDSVYYNKIIKQKNNLYNKLYNEFLSDSKHEIPITFKFFNSDTSYLQNYKLFLHLKGNQIKLLSEMINIPIETSNHNFIVNYKNKITFWVWIKDERTLFLLIFIGILFTVLYFIKCK